MKTESCYLYSRDFWIFLPNNIKIDRYNFELYRFKVGPFFETQCINKVLLYNSIDVIGKVSLWVRWLGDFGVYKFCSYLAFSHGELCKVMFPVTLAKWTALCIIVCTVLFNGCLKFSDGQFEFSRVFNFKVLCYSWKSRKLDAREKIVFYSM